MNTYAVIIEGSDDSFSGYVPDLPGCVATGQSIDEVERLLRDAIAMHIDSLRHHGEPVPPSGTATIRTVDVA